MFSEASDLWSHYCLVDQDASIVQVTWHEMQLVLLFKTRDEASRARFAFAHKAAVVRVDPELFGRLTSDGVQMVIVDPEPTTLHGAIYNLTHLANGYIPTESVRRMAA